jgi:osmotically-inducible protein OsmY
MMKSRPSLVMAFIPLEEELVTMADDERRRREDQERYRRWEEEKRGRGGYSGPGGSGGEYRGRHGREGYGGTERGGYDPGFLYGGGGYWSHDYGREGRGFFERAGDEIASWFGNEEAERRRRMDYRGRGPRAYKRGDERIWEDINDRLTDDPYVDASDIEVSVSNGEVTLSGTVDSRAVRRRAEDIAEGVSGVTHVQNNMRVQTATAAGGTSSTTGTTGTEGGTTGRQKS